MGLARDGRMLLLGAAGGVSAATLVAIIWRKYCKQSLAPSHTKGVHIGDANTLLRAERKGLPAIEPSHRGAVQADIPDILAEARRCGAFEKFSMFFDADGWHATLAALHSAFPKHFTHAFAVKANPLIKMLQAAVRDHGAGLECASLTEVEISVHAGCPPHKIVYDSPCKTWTELRRALKLGVLFNIDNLAELDRVAQVINNEMGGRLASKDAVVGLRINPLLGSGAIEALSVSNARSKFAIALNDENRQAIIEAFKRYPWLNGLHVHVGSQGCSPKMLASGVTTMLTLADEIEAVLKNGKPGLRITTLDIGGGLPTNFKDEAVSPSFADYADVLRAECPSLFTDTRRRIVTEFGRATVAKLGWVASEVEYVKQAGDRQILIGHAGSDMFLRTCYCPDSFGLRILVLGPNGEPMDAKAPPNAKAKDGIVPTDVAGPLCFGGDKVAMGVDLPDDLKPGCIAVVLDSGANALSLWSRHCSRLSPPVYVYSQRLRKLAAGQLASGKASGELPPPELALIRHAETHADLIRFWQ